MNPDTLIAVADTVYQTTPFPIDPNAAVAVVAKTTQAILAAILPGLNEQVAAAIVTAFSVGAVNVAIQLWKKFMTMAPDAIAPFWARWRKPLNTLLALAAGWLFGGTPLTGATAAVVKVLWVDITDAARKRTPEGMARARHVGLAFLIGASMLVAAGPASAGESRFSFAALDRLFQPRQIVPSVGIGGVTDLEPGGLSQSRAFGFAQLRYVWSDHVSAGVRLSSDLRAEAEGQPFQLARPRLEGMLAWVF